MTYNFDEQFQAFLDNPENVEPNLEKFIQEIRASWVWHTTNGPGIKPDPVTRDCYAGIVKKIAANEFTTQQISDFGLDTVDVALNINGYYPLYTTEAVADAVGNGESHAHVIDGVTYYMPDGGVDIYHGNYDSGDSGDSSY